MATKTELRNKCAQALGLLPVGQTLASQHQTRIDEAYDEIYAQLKTEGLNVWASDGDCPDSVNPFMANLMALTLTEVYPISEARYVRIVNKVGIDGYRGILMISKYLQPEYEAIDEPKNY
tara:strand:+ start:64 stop:423 length:360 start_codon:yes stop_codon:yes gene_type:complete